jgi:CO dehydrogenase maturation factor
MDMEAGIEHLSRGTSKSVDRLIIVVEPGRRSIETAQTILNLAQDLGVEKVGVVANNMRNDADREFVRTSLPGVEILGFIPHDPAITEADLAGRSLFTSSPQTVKEVKKIFDRLVAEKQSGSNGSKTGKVEK